jgi:hypothetical protein
MATWLALGERQDLGDLNCVQSHHDNTLTPSQSYWQRDQQKAVNLEVDMLDSSGEETGNT